MGCKSPMSWNCLRAFMTLKQSIVFKLQKTIATVKADRRPYSLLLALSGHSQSRECRHYHSERVNDTWCSSDRAVNSEDGLLRMNSELTRIRVSAHRAPHDQHRCSEPRDQKYASSRSLSSVFFPKTNACFWKICNQSIPQPPPKRR